MQGLHMSALEAGSTVMQTLRKALSCTIHTESVFLAAHERINTGPRWRYYRTYVVCGGDAGSPNIMNVKKDGYTC